MKMKLFISVWIAILLSVFGNPAMASDNLLPVGNDLSVPVDCARYQGVGYGFTLRYAPILPDGLYWKMDIGTFRQLPEIQSGCVSAGEDLALNISVIYQDVVYDTVLRYFPYSQDPQGLYWKLDIDTFKKADSLLDFEADMIRAESEGNADMIGSRTSASYLHDGTDYNCLMNLTRWDYSKYSYTNVAYLISGISYEKQSGKSLAKITRTKNVTESLKGTPAQTQTYSDISEKILVFENGKWKFYGNQKGYPVVSASQIVTCSSLDEVKWEPVGVKQSFASTDQSVGVFVEVQNVRNGSTYQFKLFKPDGSLAFESEEGKFDWEDYPSCVIGQSAMYYPFDITGNETFWNASPGQWRVDAYADGKKIGEVSFEYR